MTTEFDPLGLDVQAFAHAGAALSASDTLTDYPRLTQEAQRIAESVPALSVTWSARGEWREVHGAAPQAWLHLSATAAVPVTCQRCLTPLDAPVAVDRWFRFVADEATADAQDDDCEEDLLVTSRSFDLRALVEDELLLSLPMVPMHEQCPVKVKLEAKDPDFVDESAPEQHPFAALAGLRRPNED